MESEFSTDTMNDSDYLYIEDTEFVTLTNVSSTFVPTTAVPKRLTSNSAIAILYPMIVAEMIFSIICLVLSIIVYSILPEFKNIHGKNLISLSSCLLATFSLLCLDICLRLHISYSFCFTIAVIIHVAFLATFFWTNVMAFDIWRNVTCMKRKLERSQSTKYTKYSIYAWTATALTALPAVILESTDLVPVQYRPQFGVKRCWLSGKTAFTYYFNLPVGIILLVNLIMFILTIRRLWQIKKVTEILQIRQERKKLNLYLKLFFVMGITWIMEFVPWVTKRYELYALAGTLMALHGVLMFMIFVVKRSVFQQIKVKISELTEQDYSTNQQTSFSSGQPIVLKHEDLRIPYE